MGSLRKKNRVFSGRAGLGVRDESIASGFVITMRFHKRVRRAR